MLAPAFPNLSWQPSEYAPATPNAGFGVSVSTPAGASDASPQPDTAARELTLIDSVLDAAAVSNCQPAVHLDASLAFDRWPEAVRKLEGTHALVPLAPPTHRPSPNPAHPRVWLACARACLG